MPRIKDRLVGGGGKKKGRWWVDEAAPVQKTLRGGNSN